MVSRRQPQDRRREPPPPLDGPAIERLALRYVERFATTRGRLVDYLRRKVRERGLVEGAVPDLPALAERFADLGYIDDRAFGEARASSMARRGLGAWRVTAALQHDGIAEDDRAAIDPAIRAAGTDAALAFARRRRIGPYAAAAPPDRAAREKQVAAMLRAGHGFDLTRRIVAMAPGEVWEEN